MTQETLFSAEQVGVGDPTKNNDLILAGFWWRSFAAQIDLILFIVILSLFLYLSDVLILSVLGVGRERYVNSITMLVSSFVYYALFERSAARGTFGKRILGLTVTDLSGNRISFLRASLRHFLRIFSALFLMLGFAISSFTRRKQSAHDWITRTLVLRKERTSSDFPFVKHVPSTVQRVVSRNSTKFIAVASVLLFMSSTRVMGWLMEPIFEAATARQTVFQAISVVDMLRGAVEEQMKKGESIPKFGSDYLRKLSNSSDFAIDYDPTNYHFSIIFSGNKLLSEKKILIKAINSDAKVSWSCAAPQIHQGLLPSYCVGVVR